MTETPAPTSAEQTRQRLLEAAGEIFAERGFHQATVRDICEKAGANVAAVNYHFGDKLKLYIATLEHWIGAAMQRHPPSGGLPPGAPAEKRLHAFIRSLLYRLMDEGVPAWHGRLMAREMADPVPGAFDAVIEEHIRPHSVTIIRIIRDLAGQPLADREARACMFSVVGQCIFYRHCEHTICKLDPHFARGGDRIERLADHITRFSLAGIRAIGKDRASGKGASAKRKERA